MEILGGALRVLVVKSLVRRAGFELSLYRHGFGRVGRRPSFVLIGMGGAERSQRCLDGSGLQGDAILGLDMMVEHLWGGGGVESASWASRLELGTFRRETPRGLKRSRKIRGRDCSWFRFWYSIGTCDL